MHHDNRILIRLHPHQIRLNHKILKALVDHPDHACLLGLTRKDVEAALDLMQRIPNIVSQTETA